MSTALLPYNGFRAIIGETGFLVWCHKCLGYGQVRVRWSLDLPVPYRRDWESCYHCDGYGLLPRIRYDRPMGTRPEVDDFTPRKPIRQWSAHEFIEPEHEPEMNEVCQ